MKVSYKTFASRCLKVIVILTTLTLLKSTAYGQALVSDNDSIRCFDLNQQKRILKKFVQLDYYKAKSLIDSSMIDTLNVKIRECHQEVYDKELSIAKLKKKVKRRNKFILIGFPVSFSIGFFLKP